MNLNETLARVTEWWKGIDPKVRTRGLVIGLVAALVLSGLLYIAFRPQYATVFSGLTLTDSAEIVSALDTAKIASRLESGGTAIAVPRKLADQARLTAAQAGLPKSGSVGYDLINKSSLTMTESERTLQQQLLLEQQLTVTLRKISGVLDAAVKLALPKTEIFLDPKRQTEPTASVWLKAGSSLDANQVAGIVHLVSRAVPNLAPDAVTVVDQDGRVLSSNEAGSGGVIGADQLARQDELQTELERSIGTLLGQVFGEKNVAVRVKAELDFNQRSTETVRFEAPEDGEEGLVRHLEDMSEYFSGQGAGTEGTPGTGSNGSGTYQTPSDSASSVSEKRQQVIDYELDQIKEQIVYAPGAIQRLSVSVIVNTPDLGDQEEKVREAVQAAIGYDSSRSDLVSVQALSFAESTDPTPGGSDQPAAWYMGLPVQIGLGLLLAALLFLVVRSRRKSSRLLQQELQPVPLAATASAALAAAEAAELELEMPVPQDTETQRVRRHLQKMAKDKPEEFAVLIRTWLNEEG